MIVQVGHTVRSDFAIRTYQTEAELDYFLAMQFESSKENRVVDLSKPEDELKQAHKTELLQFIDSKQKNGILIATNSAQEPVGYIWVAGRGYQDPWDFEEAPAWIYDVRVSPRWRGHGLGKKLVLAAEQWSQRNGFSRIGLHVFAFNEVARRIYRSVGYDVTNCYFKKQLDLGEPPETKAVHLFDADRHQNALMALWYENFRNLAQSKGAVSKDQIRVRFDEYTGRVDFSNPETHNLVLENQAGELIGFSRIVRAKGDLEPHELAWVTVFEITSSGYSRGLAKQLLSQGEYWARQQGLDSIQTAVYAGENLAELLGSLSYQEASLYMQKHLNGYQVT